MQKEGPVCWAVPQQGNRWCFQQAIWPTETNTKTTKKFREAIADSGDSEADFSDTDEVTVQVDSIEAKAEETKSTKTHFGKKLPKHVTKDCHGPYDVSEVKDGTVEEKEVTPAPD